MIKNVVTTIIITAIKSLAKIRKAWYNNSMSALNKQIGGDHYKQFKIQPAFFSYVNEIPYLEATAIKYLCRWRNKGGVQDLEKAKHFIDLLIEFETTK